MSEEFFDVVDARDEVIGRAPRREVHARGLWHRAIHVLVFDATGRVFLQKRSMQKDVAPGLWDSSCSGHVDSGEGYDHAAQRELSEELGLQLTAPPERWFRVEAEARTGWEFVWVYRLKHDGPFVLHPDEIETGEWLATDELERRLTMRPKDYAPAFTLIWSLAADKV
jgi:isopentenyl-diphosphate delta-isomerase